MDDFATVGYLNTSPGQLSLVPDRAEMTIDLRNPDNDLMAKTEEDVAAFLKVLEEQQPGLRVEAKRMAKTTQGPFDKGIQKAGADSAEAVVVRPLDGAAPPVTTSAAWMWLLGFGGAALRPP